jgi:hypothetical protein
MPLLDHFHPPLSERRPRESIHSLWCSAIVEAINCHLPSRFYGAVNVHLGADVAADVGEFEVSVATWAPPTVSATMRAEFPDDIEVQVVDTRDGARLAAVIELGSERNKDRPTARRNFAIKYAAYLQRGVGVLIVDTVTSRLSNLHNELAALLGQPEAAFVPAVPIYTTAYRPRGTEDDAAIDVWRFPLAIGEPLPTVPLAVRGFGFVPLELEATYTRARQASRI